MSSQPETPQRSSVWALIDTTQPSPQMAPPPSSTSSTPGNDGGVNAAWDNLTNLSTFGPGAQSNANDWSFGEDNTPSQVNTPVGAPLLPLVSRSFNVEDGRALRQGKKLSAESDKDYEATIKDLALGKTNMALARIMLVQLEARDIQNRIHEDIDAKWAPSDTLVRAVKDYAYITLLSPRIHAYKGPRLALAIIDSMRSMGVSDMPSTADLGRVEQLREIASRALIDGRYNIKLRIGQSLYNDDGASVPENIGVLLQNCIGSSHAPPLVAALIRMAFLRRIWQGLFDRQRAEEATAPPPVETTDTPAPRRTKRARGSKGVPKKNQLRELTDGSEFWSTVDKELADSRKIYPSSEVLAQAFRQIYDLDVNSYGANNLPIVESRSLEEWLRNLHNATASAKQ
ncbi:hypothetical protein AAF712_015159, partial [Marasmius tenuissimus]